MGFSTGSGDWRQWKGERHVWEDDEFLIFLTFTCPTWDRHKCCRSGIVSDPNQPPWRTPDSVYHIRACSVADPCRPTRYLKRLSSGARGDRKNSFNVTELGGLLYLLLLTFHCWRANLRYFKRWSEQKCQFYLLGETPIHNSKADLWFKVVLKFYMEYL